jgi:hypothetical protein
MPFKKPRFSQYPVVAESFANIKIPNRGITFMAAQRDFEISPSFIFTLHLGVELFHGYYPHGEPYHDGRLR